MGATERVITGNHLTTDYDRQKIFRFATEYVKGGTYTNNTGGEVTIPIGTVMGRISATGILLPLATDATDGSQFVVGVAGDTFVVADTASVEDFPLVDIGDVVEDLLVLPAGDTLDDVISGQRLRDRIKGDTRGINLISVTQNSKFDN